MDWMQDKPGEKKELNVSWENNKNQLFYDVLSAMRVVGGTDYISIAEQQKYFQWFSTDCSETCAEVLQISWATFNFIE